MLSLFENRKQKKLIMGTKGKKQHGREIQFSSISPLELWSKLGLLQASERGSSGESSIMPSQLFGEEEGISDEECMRAFEVFRSDFSSLVSDEMEVPISELVISEDKGSLFIWALLFEFGKLGKMTSLHPIFKDVMACTILQKGQELGILFEAQDFDDISSFLQNKGLIQSSKESIEITQKFHQLFHKKFGWLIWK